MKYLKNVVKITLDKEKCTGCGMCVNVCPHGVFKTKGTKAEIKDPDSCIECGACSKNCPESAISVKVGVGCAAAFIQSFFKKTDPCCDCSPEPKDPEEPN